MFPDLLFAFCCHSYIALHVALLYDCLLPFLFSIFLFGCIQTVYTTYVHCISLEYYISLQYDILAHVARIFDIATSIHQVYTAYCWTSNIFITGLISCGWSSEVYSTHFILLLHDRPLMSTPFTAFILCTPCTHCMCCHCHISHLISRIRNVYIWYIHSYVMHYMVYISIQKVHSVYMYDMVYTYTPHYLIISYRYTYIPGYTTSIQHVYNWFHFQRLSIRPSFIYASSSVTFSYCPSRLRMLACG